jgi:hypothetical protein
VLNALIKFSNVILNMPLLKNWSCCHVSQVVNKVTHVMVKMATKDMDGGNPKLFCSVSLIDL